MTVVRMSRPSGDGWDVELFVDRLPCLVGRHTECDARLNDVCVSRRHCRLFRVGDQVWVEDLHSPNGTAVNGEPVEDARPLRDGDRLTLGLLRVRVVVATPELTVAYTPER